VVRTGEDRARSRAASSVSIMTFPTNTARSDPTPSRARFAIPDGSETNNRSLIASVSIRLISSGMSRSRERSPASTWITSGRLRVRPNARNGSRRKNLAVTAAQAMVELTSPTTTTP
jgi:cellulase/cellobiase CelA1